MGPLNLHELPPPSEEQRIIVESVIEEGCHVLVDAVAGAGKTTTILHVAAAMSCEKHGQQMLALTYNAKLKSETRERCARMGIVNVAVHTYHSAALNIYGDPACARDDGIARLLQQQSPERRPITGYRASRFQVLVVDEAQDMTHLYFALVRKLLVDVCTKDVRVLVLGDTRQAIYGFKGADARFLSMADLLSSYAPLNRPWRKHHLATSYRLAPRLAHFVNAQLLDGEKVLKSSHVGKSLGCVRYLRCNTFGELPFREIKSWLASGLQESDIFILAPSIRSNTKMSPVRILENRLVREGLRCYAASSDDERLDEDVTRGKIVFATFHQVKGLERKAVLVFNFDASYHRYFERDETTADSQGSSQTQGCPNAIYVAATRAMQRLTLLHDSKQPPMRMVKMDSLKKECEYVVDGSNYKGGNALLTNNGDTSNSSRSVTDILRHQKQEVLQAALACISVTSFGLDTTSDDNLEEGGTSTLLKSKTETGDDSWENVAAITGTAMPCMFELRSCGRCTLLTRAALNSKSLPAVDRIRIKKLESRQDTRSLSTSDFLYIANIHIALVGGFTHKLRQIKVYDWVKDTDVNAMMEVMEHHVQGPPADVSYEVPAAMVIDLPLAKRKVKLACAVDCVDPCSNTAFEIKCVSNLSTEHILQTALNGLLFEMSLGGEKNNLCNQYKHVLLNLCGGAAFQVHLGAGAKGAMQAAVILMEAKYAADKLIDDATFLTTTEVGAKYTRVSPLCSKTQGLQTALGMNGTWLGEESEDDDDDGDGGCGGMHKKGQGKAYAFMSDEDDT